MSERKVLNKYYPPDFDPSKIPRAKGSKNRQFTVRLMAPCNMKCYTCGEYIAQGKKFNARKEDVEDMTYLGLRIYRFYIRCPGCISEISFRTDPESTDYIIEAGAHRNFQALKLAEQQAEREAKDAQEEIESNPMLLLENRTKQSQYEMDLLESLEDVRELNERRAVLDPGAIAVNFQKARELSSEEIAEAESLEACKALGYELIEGKLIKRINEDLLNDEIPRKKMKTLVSTPSDHLTDGKPLDKAKVGNSLKAKLSGLVRKKTPTTIANTENKMNISSLQLSRKSRIDDSIRMPPPQCWTVAVNNNKISASNNFEAATTSMTSTSKVTPAATSFSVTKPDATAPTCDADAEVVENPISSMSSGLTLLGAYSNSDSDSD